MCDCGVMSTAFGLEQPRVPEQGQIHGSLRSAAGENH